MNFVFFLPCPSRDFGVPYAMVVNTRLDGRAVQGAGFRHQSLRRRGFESHSNHLNFFWELDFDFCVGHFFCCRVFKRIGAAEARWAHNPKVPGSKPGFASVPPSSVGRAQDS